MPAAVAERSGSATLPVSCSSTAGSATVAAGGSSADVNHMDSGNAVSDNDQQVLIREG